MQQENTAPNNESPNRLHTPSPPAVTHNFKHMRLSL